jgi:hypothetical protein
MQYQVLVYDVEGAIVSSQHYDQEPTEELMNDLLNEDEAVKGEVYLVEGDEYSKHLFTYELMF